MTKSRNVMGNRSLSRRAVITALAGAVASCALAGSITARAQGPKPRVDVMVLLAKQDPKGGKIDPRVAKLPQIAQPPFNAYNTWSLVDQKALTLDQAKPADPWKGKPMATYALPNGKTLEIALLDALSGGRFQIGTSISQGVSPDLIKYNAPAGEPVFIAGQGYKDGILVVGITLLP